MEGPEQRADAAASSLEDWVTVGPGDGMYNVVDPTDSRWVYNTRELNQMGRMDQKTGVRTDIAPAARAGRAAAALQLDRADRAFAAQPADRLRRRAGALPLARPRRSLGRDQPGPHDERSGQDRATTCRSARSRRSRSRRSRPASIWVGTDDGKVQVTANHGGTWTDVTPALAAAGAPVGSLGQPRVRVAARRRHGVRLEERLPQRRLHAVPLSDDGLRQDVDVDQRAICRRRRSTSSSRIARTRICSSSATTSACSCRSTSARAGRGSRRTCRPSRCTTSSIHPRENDLVLGTYGRGFWTGDITPLQELTPEVLDHKRAPVRHRAARALRLRHPGHELPPVRRQVHRGAERARRARRSTTT